MERRSSSDLELKDLPMELQQGSKYELRDVAESTPRGSRHELRDVAESTPREQPSARQTTFHGKTWSRSLAGNSLLVPDEPGDVEAMMHAYGYHKEESASTTKHNRYEMNFATEKYGLLNSVRNQFHSIANSTAFQALFAALIFLNAVVMGVQVDLPAGEAHVHLDFLNDLFTAAFLVEAVVRVIGSRVYPWRDAMLVMDVSIVVMGAVDMWVFQKMDAIEQANLDLKVLFLIRLLRMTRFLRIFRAAFYLRPVRILMSATGAALNSLFWVIVILLCIFYMFALVFRMLLGDTDPSDPVYDIVQKYFRSVGVFIVTALEILCRGFSWTDAITNPLLQNDGTTLAGIMWVVFIIVTQLGIVNLIVGIFVEQLIGAASVTDEEYNKEKLVTDAFNMSKLKNWFNEMDKNAVGYITKAQFRQGLHRFIDLRETLGIQVDEAGVFFQNLDLQSNGKVKLEDFLFGVLRLKGGTKSVDMLTFDFQIRQILRLVNKSPAQMENLAQRLAEFEQRLDSLGHQIVSSQTETSSRMPEFIHRLDALEQKMEMFLGRLQVGKGTPRGPTPRAASPDPHLPVRASVEHRGKVRIGENTGIPDEAVMEPWMRPGAEPAAMASRPVMTLSNIRESYQLQSEMERLRSVLKLASMAAQGGPEGVKKANDLIAKRDGLATVQEQPSQEPPPPPPLPAPIAEAHDGDRLPPQPLPQAPIGFGVPSAPAAEDSSAAPNSDSSPDKEKQDSSAAPNSDSSPDKEKQEATPPEKLARKSSYIHKSLFPMTALRKVS